MTAGAIRKQIQMLLFDAIFHITPRAVHLFVEFLSPTHGIGEMGHDEAGIGTFGQIFSFPNHLSLA